MQTVPTQESSFSVLMGCFVGAGTQSADHPTISGVGWLTANRAHANDLQPMDSMLSTSAYSYSHSLTGSALQQFEHPTARLLQDSGFRQIRYLAWKQACLEERVTEGAWPPASRDIQSFKS